MDFLGYIAGTLIAPNLASYLISNKLMNGENRKIISEIEAMIIRFNSKFDDKEVDSNFFVDYLKQKEVYELIFERVFKSYKSKKVDYDVLSVELGKEAVCYVNERKDKYKHPRVKIPSDFIDYFKELFKVLLEYRESLLDIRAEALVATLDDSISSSEDRIIKELEKQNGDNFLLQGRIEEIETLVDKGLHDEAFESLSNVFETIGNISNEQRAKLLFQKARIFINTEQLEKAIQMKKSISHYRSESSYLDEIDYWVAFHNSNLDMVEEALTSLRGKGECVEKLTLKLTNFYLAQGEYSKVIENIATGLDELVDEYKQHASAYYQLGVVNAVEGNYSVARDMFEKARSIKYHRVYEYNFAMSSATALLERVKQEKEASDEIKKEAEKISDVLKQFKSFNEKNVKEARLVYWWNYLNLLGLYQHTLIIDEYPSLEEDIKHEEPIAVIVSEAYYLEKRFAEACPFLEKIWQLDPLFLSRLFHVYSELDKWDLIDNMLKKDVSHLYDDDGNVFYYKVESQIVKGNITEAVNLIRSEGEKFKDKLWFQRRVFDFAHEHKVEDVYEEYSLNIFENIEAIDFDARVSFAKSFYKHEKMHLVSLVLKSSYKHSQEASELYLHSLGDITPKSKDYAELRKVTYELYDEGNHSEYVLQTKFYIELFTQSYDFANDSLEEYEGLFGKDMFYCLNRIQHTIFSNSDYDATDECEQLVKESSLKHQLMVAQYYGYKGMWQEAKVYLSNSFYRFHDKVGEEETAGLVQIYFLNTHQENDEVEYERACNDSVIMLRSEIGESRNISIISNESLVKTNGEKRLGCENIRGSSDRALMLKAVSKKNSSIDLDGVTYRVEEILNLHTYIFRYFYSKLLTDFPDNQTLIPVYGDSVEELVDNMSEIMAASQKNTKIKLGFYDFEVETGVPISYLSDKNNGKYLDTIDFLLVNPEQRFYSSYPSREKVNSKYVLSISSLILLNYFGMLDRLIGISNKIVVSQSMKPFIRKGLTDSIKYDAVVSTAYLDENDDFRMIESSEDNKEQRRKFWSDLMISLNSFDVERAETVNKEFYDILHEFVDVCEFEAIDLSKREEYTLVCDDLFISKICESINGKSPQLNAIGLLYLENLLTFEELLEIVLKASKFKMINCVNHNILFDIFKQIVNENGSDEFDKHFAIAVEIFDNLFDESTNGFNQHLYQRFINETKNHTISIKYLYKLLEKPFGFVPYEEFVASKLGNMRIRFKLSE